MIKNCSLLAVFALLAGCASSNNLKYDIISDPPNAPVEVNGVSMGETPTSVELGCSKKWVGLVNAPGGWANTSGPYEIKAYPPRGFSGQSQTRRVDPCQWSGEGVPRISFDLNLESVEPKQRLEIINDQSGGDLEEIIQSLRNLRDSGVISDEEYQQKVLDVTK